MIFIYCPKMKCHGRKSLEFCSTTCKYSKKCKNYIDYMVGNNLMEQPKEKRSYNNKKK